MYVVTNQLSLPVTGFDCTLSRRKKCVRFFWDILYYETMLEEKTVVLREK